MWSILWWQKEGCLEWSAKDTGKQSPQREAHLRVCPVSGCGKAPLEPVFSGKRQWRQIESKKPRLISHPLKCVVLCPLSVSGPPTTTRSHWRLHSMFASYRERIHTKEVNSGLGEVGLCSPALPPPQQGVARLGHREWLFLANGTWVCLWEDVPVPGGGRD